MNASLWKKATSKDVAMNEIKRLTFAFKLPAKASTLSNHLDAVLEVFNAFNRERDTELIPDCIGLQFDSYSRTHVDLPTLYAQLKDFVDPFTSKGWRTPALAINTHHIPQKVGRVELILTWQDKTYEQFIRRPAATWRCEK